MEHLDVGSWMVVHAVVYCEEVRSAQGHVESQDPEQERVQRRSHQVVEGGDCHRTESRTCGKDYRSPGNTICGDGDEILQT